MNRIRFLTLLGVKHVGKSSVAHQIHNFLAERSHFSEIFDTDQHIISQFQTEATRDLSVSIRDVYRKVGKERFHHLEAEALESLSRLRPSPGNSITIIATGGGLADNNAALPALEGLRPLLYLWGDPEVLYERIARRGVPPFLTSTDPQGEFIDLAYQRDKMYRKIADQVIDTTDRTPQDVAHIIVSEMRY